ncbi:MAG: hypothetical protein AAB879_00795, partial [Patescibacteria group bacterium]
MHRTGNAQRMRMLVDARPIVDSRAGGVVRVAREVVTAAAKEFPHDSFVCVTTGWKKPELPKGLRDLPNVTHAHLQI